MTALRLALIATLAGLAFATPADSREPKKALNIAPGTPATVGQNGAVVGEVPGKVVPAPNGAMSTFGTAQRHQVPATTDVKR